MMQPSLRGAILLPYHDPVMGQMWMPSGTRAIWDFRSWRGSRVPDLSQTRPNARMNIVIGGEFETDANSDGIADYFTTYITGAGETPSLDSSIYVAGTKSQKIIIARGAYRGARQAYAFVAGRTYYIGGWVRKSAGTVNALGYRVLANTTNKYTVSGTTITADTWTWIEGSYIADGTEDYFAIVAAEAGVDQITVWFDGFVIYDMTASLPSNNTLTLSGATDTGLTRYFDGTDDSGLLENSSALDVTTAPLAIATTVKMPSVLQSGYFVCKNLDALGNVQYGINIIEQTPTTPNTGRINVILEGNVRWASYVVLYPDKTYNICAIWNGTTVVVYLNGAQIAPDLALAAGTHSGSLTSQPYFRVARRETATGHFKGDIYDISIYRSADVNTIMRHQRPFMRRAGIAASGG